MTVHVSRMHDAARLHEANSPGDADRLSSDLPVRGSVWSPNSPSSRHPFPPITTTVPYLHNPSRMHALHNSFVTTSKTKETSMINQQHPAAVSHRPGYAICLQPTFSRLLGLSLIRRLDLCNVHRNPPGFSIDGGPPCIVSSRHAPKPCQSRRTLAPTRGFDRRSVLSSPSQQ